MSYIKIEIKDIECYYLNSKRMPHLESYFMRWSRLKAFLMLFVLFCLTINSIYAGKEYKSVLGLPFKFENVSESQINDLENFIKGPTGTKSKNKPWQVICDRENVETYLNIGGTSKSRKKLKFGDWFYVLDEKGSYIYLGKMNGEPDKNLRIKKGTYMEKYGWIEKSEMLLWTSGIKSRRSGLSLKSITLYNLTENRVNNVKMDYNQIVKTFKGPGIQWGEFKSIELYEFFFILDTENGYNLISNQDKLTKVNNIIGWIEMTDQIELNTNLFLEVNFDSSAYEERKLNAEYQFVAFLDKENAYNHAKYRSGKSSGVISTNDPCTSKIHLSAKNHRRHVGTKWRMPVLACHDEFYETVIPVLDWAGFPESGVTRQISDNLIEILTKHGIDPTEENLNTIRDRKVPLFVRAYVPKRIYGASHDLCSQVLLFSEKELAEYLEDIRSLVASLDNEPDDILRTRLKETLLTLYKKYSGETKVGNDVTLNDFVGFLTRECFKFHNQIPQFTINNMDNPKVKIETLRNFLNELEKKYRNLESISKMSNYEFKFQKKSGASVRNQYYWIPLEDTF